MARLLRQIRIGKRGNIALAADDFVRFGVSDGNVRGTVAATITTLHPSGNGRSQRFAGTGIEVGRFELSARGSGKTLFSVPQTAQRDIMP